MDAAQMFVYMFISVIILVCPTRIDSSVQHCKYTSIHIVNEDGQEQVLTVKDPESDSSCGCQPPQQGTLESQCHIASTKSAEPSPAKKPPPQPAQPQKEQQHVRKLFQATAPDSLPYPAHRLPLPPFNNGGLYWGLVPTVMVMVGDVMSTLCGGSDEADICATFRLIIRDCGDHGDNPPDGCGNREYIEQCASYLVDNNQLPVPTGDTSADSRIAYGHVLIGAGYSDEAVDHFTTLVREYPNLSSAYHGRGVAYISKGLVNKLAERAISDFQKASELEPDNPEHFQRMAELYLPLKRYSEAVNCVTKVVELSERPTSRILFLKATLELTVENLKIAESDYRKSLKMGEFPYTDQTYYNLALTLYYRGLLRNSIETFKELIQKSPDNLSAHCGLAHAYSTLGDAVNAVKTFNKTLTLKEDYLLARQLKATFHYNYGSLKQALADFQKCLAQDPTSYKCQYMESLTYTSLGQFYKAIKGFTKVMVNKTPTIKMSPEFIKSQYLREYGRFLHHNLDENLMDIDFDKDLPNEFKHKWVKVEPFTFKNAYIEQPGLSPSISDLNIREEFLELPLEAQELICFARNIGMLMTSPTDAYVHNTRKQLLMGFAAIHVAEAMRDVWEDVGASKTDLTMTWRKMFNIAVQYIRLANPEEPIFWLDLMDTQDVNIGYTQDVYIIKGHTLNAKMMHYFDLVYRLIRTMISVHCGEGEMYPEQMMVELTSVETYEQLIDVFKKELFRDHGFVMSTQLSSMKNPKGPKHEGVMLSISSNKVGKMSLAVNMPFNKEKAHAVYQEMDYIFFELYHEIKKWGGRSSEDPDHIINLILSLVYYFLNLSPISHGSSAVAWSVAVGLIMSVGRDVTGKMPPGKLLDLEAALTGGPEVFSSVTKNWMKIKRMKENPLLKLQRVSSVFPTLRDVLEAVTHTHVDCYKTLMLANNIVL